MSGSKAHAITVKVTYVFSSFPSSLLLFKVFDIIFDSQAVMRKNRDPQYLYGFKSIGTYVLKP